MQYGCIGEHLAHSFSKEIHEALAPYTYDLLELSRDALTSFFSAREFRAINVTIPYKEAVLPYLDEVDAHAREIGAVNTVVNRDGKLYGYNTDFYGMCTMLAHAGICPKGRKVAILGTGGTAKTALAVLSHLGARQILTVSRTPVGEQVGYRALREQHADTEIIINTTPVGMYPDTDAVPLDLSDFPMLCALVDAIYNPLRTNLVLDAKARGIRAEGGLYMLVAQAVRASELFLDMKYSEQTTEALYRDILAKKENLVLIGMPSCGKSTTGRLLAERLSRPFLDTDTVFLEKYGISAEQYIRTYGEDAFRDEESTVCALLSKQTGCVIACGGGVVLREENMRALSRSGTVIFLDRPLDLLCATADRPLSADREALAMRYRERIASYRAYADITVEGAHTPSENTEIIINEIGQRISK